MLFVMHKCQFTTQRKLIYLPSSNFIDIHTSCMSMPKPITRRTWSWMVLWRPIRPFRTNTQKRCPFFYRGLECKSRKLRDTWSNRQIWPGTKWSMEKANRVLPRDHTGHSKHPLPATQEKTRHRNVANVYYIV